MREIPWWVPAAVDRLSSSLLRPDWRVFEWGAGFSTLWLAQRVAHVVSIEHDPMWDAELRPRLPANVWFRFIPSDRGVVNFGDYVDAILNEPGAFDLIIVDGEMRSPCMWLAFPRVKPGGWLLLDNSEREALDMQPLVAGWHREDYLAAPGDWYDGCVTTLWRRP